MSILLHRSLVRLLSSALLLASLAACSFPGVYKLDIQQGNIVTQDMVNQLKPGMTRRQVRFIMGTPLITDSFADDRWDYFYSLRNGDNEMAQERLTLIFAGDQLVSLQGNFHPEETAGVESTGNTAK